MKGTVAARKPFRLSGAVRAARRADRRARGEYRQRRTIAAAIADYADANLGRRTAEVMAR